MSIINLLPDDYIRRRQQERTNGLCMVLFLVVMVGLAAALGVSERASAHTRHVADRMEVEYAEAAKLLAQLQELEGQKQKVMDKTQRTAGLLDRVPRSTLLAMIANALPRQASLTRFALVPKKVVSRAAGEGQSKFQNMQAQRTATQMTEVPTLEVDGLAGTDVDVALFIANLIRNPLLSGVDLVYSQEKVLGGYPVREFQVRMEVRPDGDVMDVLGRADGGVSESAGASAETGVSQ